MNKKIGVIAAIILILLIGGSLFYYFTKEDKNSLTVTEKSWIENNKNKLIDLSIPSDIAVLSNNGDGVVFDFLESLEKNTSLDFNKLSYTNGEKASSDYQITVTNNTNKNDILIYEDSYALVTKTKIKYNNTSEIKNIIVGVLENDLDSVNKYLLGSIDVTYKPYKNVSLMINDMKENTIDAMAVPRLANLNSIIEEELNIAYNITELKENYVLKLGNTNTLNKILKKYYKKWSTSNFEEEFNKRLAESYFKIKDIDEKEQVKFRSKRYNYGFVLNNPFDVTTKDGIRGLNYSFLNSFAKATNIEMNYKKYSSIENMIKDFENNNLDIIFDYHDKNKYKMDVYNTVSVYDEKISIITNENTDLTINSVNSLQGKEIKTIQNSKIDSYLKEHGVKTKPYKNSQTLIQSLNKKDLAAIDTYTYDHYVRNDLAKYKNLFTFNLEDDYTFVARDISSNRIFNELFDFYLTFSNDKQIINNSYKDLIAYASSNKLIQLLIALFSAVVLVLAGIIAGKLVKKHKDHNSKLSKTDKLRYIDSLTSLKNRNYLNDNISKWDSSEAYPQAILVVDLNNVAYINDNFGHAEGDKVIVEGAGILINNQLPNSEIMRTNGNEFLVFMVGHDEKTVVTYIRKLYKQFKNLSHNFGAAIGYSMITDEIKTIDDAINEATIDMKNNKEEIK
ncbi:MAG: GGDEF domain-containing protein [Bacilli bacterium]|nr:GGDEF domain-containing protein [Bacilli bacterium]